MNWRLRKVRGKAREQTVSSISHGSARGNNKSSPLDKTNKWNSVLDASRESPLATPSSVLPGRVRARKLKLQDNNVKKGGTIGRRGNVPSRPARWLAREPRERRNFAGQLATEAPAALLRCCQQRRLPFRGVSKEGSRHSPRQ